MFLCLPSLSSIYPLYVIVSNWAAVLCLGTKTRTKPNKKPFRKPQNPQTAKAQTLDFWPVQLSL